MLHSFDIHIAQCRELFAKREELKPEKERRKIPNDPLSVPRASKSSASASYDLDFVNDASFKAFNDNLSPCHKCGRTFLPEKLIIHLRSCKASAPASATSASSSYSTTRGVGNGNDNKIYETQGFSDYAELMKCPSCGRTFNEFSFPKLVMLLTLLNNI
jgi:protein-arginine kinase activator protein McsA